MGVKIYNEADLETIQKLKGAANVDNKQTLESLDTIEGGTADIAEAVATIYEDGLNHNNKMEEVLATIYEEILGGQE